MDQTTHDLLEACRINVASLPIASSEGIGQVSAALESLEALRRHLSSLVASLPDLGEEPQTVTTANDDAFVQIAEPEQQAA